MRLARIGSDGSEVAAVAIGDRWVAIADLLNDISDPGDTIEALSRTAELQEAIVSATSASSAGVVAPRFAAPLRRPGKLIGIGLNYLDHVREIGAEVPAVPIVFAKWGTSLLAPNGTLPWRPDVTAQLDYEVELAVVIGSTVKDVPVGRALAAVAGYAVANDVSARDAQFAEGQWVRSKSFDGSCPLGPWITTADEVADPQQLALRTHVNGEQRQSSTTSEMVFGVAELIEFVSRGTTLEPGDVILTGTPPGVGAGRGGAWLQSGDVVRCEIDGLGVIEHVIG